MLELGIEIEWCVAAQKEHRKNVGQDHADTHKYKTESMHREAYTEIGREIFTQIQSDKKRRNHGNVRTCAVYTKIFRTRQTSKLSMYIYTDVRNRIHILCYISIIT